MNIIDNTALSPTKYRIRIRKPAEITTIVLHQMGFAGWKPTNPMWHKVRAHLVVKLDGTILMNHTPLTRMRWGSGPANSYCLTIEHEGNFAGADGQAWKPEVYGVHVTTPEQVTASRELIATMCETYPSIQYITAHRAIEAKKPLCCGPQLWSEIGEWTLLNLGLHEGPVLKTGSMLPASWKRPPTMCM